MFRCTFLLNGEPMSALKMTAFSFPAFSGLGGSVNRKSAACSPGHGPIPPGAYFIVDRQSGGRLGPLLDKWTGRTEWFALYAADGRIDDEAWCDAVLRGSFRLHPKGPRGISQGCVTLDQQADFNHLRAVLRSVKPTTVGDGLAAYGVLGVA